MGLDCIIKCVFAEGLWIEAQGVIAKIIVYMNGLPFSGTVGMCNHWEYQCRMNWQYYENNKLKRMFDF